MKNHPNTPPDPAVALLFFAVLCSVILGAWYAENPEVWPHSLLAWLGEHVGALAFLAISPFKRAAVISATAAIALGVPAMMGGDALTRTQRRAKARRAAKEAMEADHERAEMERVARARHGTAALVEAARVQPDRVPRLRLEVFAYSMLGPVIGSALYLAALLY